MLWVKAFHIIAMVAWFAGIFYLPRLYVYHSSAVDNISIDRFKIMERRLYYGIMTPAAVLTIVLGFWLVTFNFAVYLAAGWFYAKMLLVICLIIYHLYSGHLRKVFARDKNTHSALFYRIYNEISVLLLMGIVIFAVVKPSW
jgi:protoporphyrinogen IX oxidase